MHNPSGVGIAAHDGCNFLPGNPDGGDSIINAQAAARHAEDRPMADTYRNKGHPMHPRLALPRNVHHGVGDAVDHGRQAQDQLPRAAVKPAAIPMPAQSGPPLDPMFKKIREHMAHLDASLARTTDDGRRTTEDGCGQRAP